MMRVAFWWLMSNLPAILVISWAGARAKESHMLMGFLTNVSIWVGWLIFWGGMKWSEKSSSLD